MYSIDQAFEDSHVKTLRMVKSAPHAERGQIDLVRSPINLSAIPQDREFQRAAPSVGEHSDEVLMEFGFDRVQIEALREAGAI